MTLFYMEDKFIDLSDLITVNLCLIILIVNLYIDLVHCCTILSTSVVHNDELCMSNVLSISHFQNVYI